MKKITILVIVFLMSGPLLAQSGRRCCSSGGWGVNSRYSRMYNPATERTLVGEVVAIDYRVPMGGMSKGVHLVVKVDGANYNVHVGPQWFIDRQDVALATGDKITVTGSFMTVGQQEAIIAKQLSKGDMVLTLREDTGRPVWAGWRGRGKGRRW